MTAFEDPQWLKAAAYGIGLSVLSYVIMVTWFV